MSSYNHIPLTVERDVENYCNFPQSYTVPEGWEYKTYADRDYRYAYCEMTIDLYCAGDWLEIVSPDGTERILYELY